MALNEMIAQGAQFKMPDPLEQYGKRDTEATAGKHRPHETGFRQKSVK